MSGVFSIASHSAEQYFPSVTMQLQTGCAHFFASAIFVLPPRPSYQLYRFPPIPLPMQARLNEATPFGVRRFTRTKEELCRRCSLPTPKPFPTLQKRAHLPRLKSPHPTQPLRVL